jgi:hypothetical protein
MDERLGQRAGVYSTAGCDDVTDVRNPAAILQVCDPAPAVDLGSLAVTPRPSETAIVDVIIDLLGKSNENRRTRFKEVVNRFPADVLCALWPDLYATNPSLVREIVHAECACPRICGQRYWRAAIVRCDRKDKAYEGHLHCGVKLCA